MPYLYATEDQDFSDFSSGRVIYSQAGAPAFPVRLASEMFQRAARYLPDETTLTLFDPTSGGAYHLTALGLLHAARIGRILASDVDPRALELARRNLALLSLPGLAQREHELEQMLAAYGKASHADALGSLERLRALLTVQLSGRASIETRVFAANALDRAALTSELDANSVQLVLCDLPYGRLSSWQLPPGITPPANPAWGLLEALRGVLAPAAVVVIAADKAQKPAHAAYRRLERFQIGKRQVNLLQPL